MGIIHAFTEGLSSATRRVGIVFWLWVASLLLALPASLIVIDGIEESLEDSQMSQRLAEGYDDLWYREFDNRAEGILETFDPTVVGIGAILNGLDEFIQGELWEQHAGLAAVSLAYLLLWVFAAGGVLTSLAGGSKLPFPDFARAGAEFFWRFVRLAILLFIGYAILWGWLLPAMDDMVESLTRETIDERVVFAWTILKYGVLLFLLMLLNMTGDYAKIICVLEKRRSILVSGFRAFKVGLGNLTRTFPLYLLFFLLGVVIMLVYWILAPGAGQQSFWSVALAFALGQIYIASRIWLRICFWGGQTTLAQAILEQKKEVAQRREETSATAYPIEDSAVAE